jgi:hypothetical protein
MTTDFEKLRDKPDSEIDYSDIPTTDDKFWENAEVEMPISKLKPFQQKTFLCEKCATCNCDNSDNYYLIENNFDGTADQYEYINHNLKFTGKIEWPLIGKRVKGNKKGITVEINSTDTVEMVAKKVAAKIAESSNP